MGRSVSTQDTFKIRTRHEGPHDVARADGEHRQDADGPNLAGEPDLCTSLSAIRARSGDALVFAGLEMSGIATALFSPDDTLAFGSSAFRDLFAVQAEAPGFDDIMRHCHAECTGPVIMPPIETWLEMAHARRRSQPQRTFEIDIADGRWFLVNETLLADGWIWSVFTDITMLKSNENVLKLDRDAARLAAETDPLTGLFNRRHGMDRLESAVLTAFRTGAPLTLVLIDLDHFKAINDTYGHQHGDKVLCHFAAAGRDQLRGQDMFARVGGEEFMALMPGTTAREAAQAIERLRSHIAEPEQRARINCRYTLSAGIAEFCGETADALFARADRALYQAKNLGRDRIERAA